MCVYVWNGCSPRAAMLIRCMACTGPETTPFTYSPARRNQRTLQIPSTPPLQAVVTWRAGTPRRAPRHLGGRRRMLARSLSRCSSAASSQVTPNTDSHRATPTPRAPRHVAMHAATSPIDGSPPPPRPDACAASIIHFPHAAINTSPHARPWPSTNPSHFVHHTIHSGL